MKTPPDNPPDLPDVVCLGEPVTGSGLVVAVASFQALPGHVIDPPPGVRVGVTAFVRKSFGSEGKILTGVRQGSHAAGCLSSPGGHLEYGESFEQCGRREIREECGEGMAVRFRPVHPPEGALWVSNNFHPNKHHVTVWCVFDWVAGDPRNSEPEKLKGEWEWRSFNEIVDALPRELVRAWELHRAAPDHPQAQWLPLDVLTHYRHLIGI